MTIRRLCALTAIASVLAAATATGAAAPARPVLAEASGDLNGDGVPDRAVLTGAEDEVDLAVYLSANGALPNTPTVYREALGWKGTLAGTAPEISVTPRGSLVVVFQNDSIGRNRWREQFTIAFRNGALTVAGYTYATRDTLDPKQSGACDVNLLSGKGVRNGKPVTVPVQPVRLADWSQAAVPEACAF